MRAFSSSVVRVRDIMCRWRGSSVCTADKGGLLARVCGGLRGGVDLDATVKRGEGDSRLVTLRSGRRLGVVSYGDPDGLPVLALHGAPASRLMFDVADAPARACGVRLIAFDRPGYGLSPLDYGATLKSRTEVFAELPDALGLDRFTLLGVSGGGPYAVALAAQLGARIRALALVSPLGPVAELCDRALPDPLPLSMSHRALFLDLPRHPWVLRANAEIAVHAFRAAPKIFASAFSHLLPQSDRDVIARDHVMGSMIDMTMEATRHGIQGGIADLEIYSEPWHVDYQKVTAPARVWQGTADSIVPVQVALKLGEMIPGCDVTRLEEGGHFWIYNAIPDVLSQVATLSSA